MQTVEQLSTEVDPEVALDDVLDITKALGFDTTVAEQSRQVGWSAQSGSFLPVTATIGAKLWVYLSRGSVTRTLAMRLETATKTALDWWCMSQYQEKRNPAITTQGILLLTDVKGVGPITFTASRYVVKDPVTGATFRNLNTVTLPLNGTVQVNVECELDGTVGNSPNDRITQWVSSVSGVTVTNPAQPLTGTWITRTGINQESDESYKRRCKLKWATLGPNAPKSAYEWFALNALDGLGNPVGITKVRCGSPNGFGQFGVYIANDTATATPTQVSDVQAWINTRKNPTSRATVSAATLNPVDGVFTIRVSRGRGAAAAAEARQAMIDYIVSLPLGGARFDSGNNGVVPASELEAICMNVPGVLDVRSTAIRYLIVTPSELVVPGTLTVNFVEA